MLYINPDSPMVEPPLPEKTAGPASTSMAGTMGQRSRMAEDQEAAERAKQRQFSSSDALSGMTGAGFARLLQGAWEEDMGVQGAKKLPVMALGALGGSLINWGVRNRDLIGNKAVEGAKGIRDFSAESAGLPYGASPQGDPARAATPQDGGEAAPGPNEHEAGVEPGKAGYSAVQGAEASGMPASEPENNLKVASNNQAIPGTIEMTRAPLFLALGDDKNASKMEIPGSDGDPVDQPNLPEGGKPSTNRKSKRSEDITQSKIEDMV